MLQEHGMRGFIRSHYLAIAKPAAIILVAVSGFGPASAENYKPALDLEQLSGMIYDHQSYSLARSDVYDRARAAVTQAVPDGTTLSDAKARLETAGMQCRSIKRPADLLRCHAVLLESFEDRDPSSIIWDVDVSSTNGIVSNVRVNVS
jgi:hypothetical protein